LRAGFPSGQPLPTKPYVGNPKVLRPCGSYSGKEWVDLGTRTVDHQAPELRKRLTFLDPKQPTLEILKAVLKRYIFGWTDLADRNYCCVAGQVYMIDGDRFNDKTMNPLGRYIRTEDARDALDDLLRANASAVRNWLEKMCSRLSDETAQRLVACDFVRPLWPVSPFKDGPAFLRLVNRRIGFLMEGLRVERLGRLNCYDTFLTTQSKAERMAKLVTLPEKKFAEFLRLNENVEWIEAGVSRPKRKESPVSDSELDDLLAVRPKKVVKCEELEEGEILLVD
jgi:hypothetical protein